jgi:hypothetical protein
MSSEFRKRFCPVIPANAGIQVVRHPLTNQFQPWTPASAGVTINMKANSRRPCLSEKILALLALFFTCHLALGTRNAFSDSGQDAFQFLKLGADARQSAMADSVVAAPEGVASAQTNPAAWGALRGRELSLHYAAPTDGMAFGSLAYGQQTRSAGWGLFVQQLRYSGINGYDESGSATGNVAAGDLLLAAGAGRSWREDWNFGVNVKQARETIAGRSASILLGDAGVLYAPAGSPLSLGAAIRNEGGKTSFLSEKVSAVSTLEAGAALKTWSDALLFTARVGKASDEKTNASAGGELWIQNALAFRAGFQSGNELGTGATFGVGLKIRDMRLDYAFQSNGGDFQPAHRVTLSFRFGVPAEALYQEGIALLQKGRTAEAVLKFKAALDIDPHHYRAEKAFQEAVRKLERERNGK